MLGERCSVGSSRYLGVNGRGCTYSSGFYENYGVTFDGILPEHNGTMGGFKRPPAWKGNGFLSLAARENRVTPRILDVSRQRANCKTPLVHVAAMVGGERVPMPTLCLYVGISICCSITSALIRTENNAPEMLIRNPTTFDSF
jgi:hypothetical protein